MKNKICFITENFFPHVGGVEKYFLDIAKGLILKGYEVRVVTSNSGGKTGYFEFEGVPVYSYKWFILSDHAFPKGSDLLEHVKWADIVHTTTYTAGPIANRMAHKFRKPCVIIIHEVLGRKWHWIEKNPLMAIGYRLFEYFCVKQKYDYFLCNSYATQRDLENTIGLNQNVKTIHLSVEESALANTKADRDFLTRYFDVPAESRIFLYYGRPGQPKGIFVYLDAIKKLMNFRDIDKNIKFLFLLSKQPISQRRLFCRLINKYNLNDYVKVADSVSHDKLYSLVKAADYVVVPSITEGFGFTCVESCALGIKVIHSSGGSLPEVAYGNTRVFNNRDSNDLCRILSETIDFLPFFKSRKKVFSIEKHIEHLISVYENLINE